MPFETNVFINCPFDQKFKKFLEPILFTVLYCDFNPLISQTRDSGKVRLNSIIDLVRNSKYSIHDLSRNQASQAGEISRFNMPFELGIDLGIRHSGVKQFEEKKCLILDTKKYQYQAALSDISGNDIEIYYESVQELIRVVRNWLGMHNESVRTGPRLIYENFCEFKVHLYETLSMDGFSRKDIKHLSKNEFIALAHEWIELRKRKLS